MHTTFYIKKFKFRIKIASHKSRIMTQLYRVLKNDAY